MKYKKEIDNSHPIIANTTESLLLDKIAMELVGERESKRDLVNLVRWLLMGGVDIIKSNNKKK